MLINAKFPGTCSDCRDRFPKGARIEWQKGAGAKHERCAHPTEMQTAAELIAPCWDCKGPNGKARNHGPAAPYLCDDCHATCPECAYQKFMRSNERCEHCHRQTSWDYERKRPRCMNCCPGCHGPISKDYARKGYQCDGCADREEGIGF